MFMTQAMEGWKNYALTLGLFALALGLRFLVLPVEAGLAYLTFYPGLVICALLFGWRPALLFIVLAAIIGTYIFVPPHYLFARTDIVPEVAFVTAAMTMLVSIEIFKQRAAIAPAVKVLTAPSGVRALRWLWLVLGLLVLMGVANIWQNLREIDDNAELRRTHEIQTHMNALLASETDAETGMRGYVITGKEAFLEPYRGARERVAAELLALRELIDDPIQQQRLEQLEPIVRKRLDRLVETHDIMQSEGFAAAQARVSSGIGKSLQDDIRRVLTACSNTKANCQRPEQQWRRRVPMLLSRSEL